MTDDDKLRRLREASRLAGAWEADDDQRAAFLRRAAWLAGWAECAAWTGRQPEAAAGYALAWLATVAAS